MEENGCVSGISNSIQYIVRKLPAAWEWRESGRRWAVSGIRMVLREHVCGRGGWATSVSAKSTASGEEVYWKEQFTPPPTLRLKLCPPKKAARPTGLTLVLRSSVTTRRPSHTSPAYKDCTTRALVLAPSWRTAYSNGPSVTYIFIRKCFAPRHVHNRQIVTW